jgi:hypothetical protein
MLQPGHGRGSCLPLGSVLALIGGLTMLLAYYTPWFGLSSAQGTMVLPGDFLNRFLNSPGSQRELQFVGIDPGLAPLLRPLVLFFPACGALAALAALALGLLPHLRRTLQIVLGVLGLAPLLALLAGLSQLPPGSTLEIGLRLIGAGAVAVLAGVLLDLLLDRPRKRDASPSASEVITTESPL